ncbi:MAG TPA: hypothetical protein VFW79_05280 [Cellulomonas sp.]|uniref:hypothetical protein n=1 Tax=Cellulomonas sp. TaxID=40001 RepID=UPI002E3627A3|nr:hypothetical protein [Cellulomonas sp.]HEX5332037.1 hypothetical protein [Cellulomonas sp.]
MSADRVRSGARAGLPGVGTLDAAGGPVAWCRSTERATRRVADLDARLDAVCARAPRTPTLVRGPVLGHALDDCLRRLDQGDAPGVEVPDGTGTGVRDGSGTGWDDRTRRRPSGTGGDGRSWDGDGGAAAVPRARHVGRVGPASALEPRVGPSTAVFGGSAQRGAHGVVGTRRVAVDGADAGAGVTADRLRALAGPVPMRVLAGPTAPGGPTGAGRAHRRGPGADRRPVEPRASGVEPSAPSGPPAVTGPEHAAVVAARVLRRIAGRPGSATALARSVPRPDAGPADQALVDVLVRWSAWRGPAAEATDDGSSDARGGAPAASGARRRRRGRGRTEPAQPGGERVGATPGPELGASRRPSTPAVDEHPVRSPSRFAEQPTRPRRLADVVDPPADEDAAGDAGPGTDGVGLRPGLARVAVDTSAATGIGGTVPTVSAPELERVLARVLRDAASRHGIEV